MGIITKGLRGILTITKTNTRTKKAYVQFINNVSVKNGVKYKIISQTEKDTLVKLSKLFKDEQKRDFLVDTFFVDKSDQNYIKEFLQEDLQEELKKQRADFTKEVKELLDKKSLNKIKQTTYDREVEKLNDKFDDNKARYILKIEELEQTQDNKFWNEHASGKSILGQRRSIFIEGMSYASQRREMLITTEENNRIYQYLVPAVPYGKWIILRDYQGFVPNNGLGTYTIRNIRKKAQWIRTD